MPKLMMMVFFCVMIYPFIPAFLGKVLYPKRVWNSLRPEKYVLSRHASQIFSESGSMNYVGRSALKESAWVLVLILPLLYAVKHEETTLLAAAMVAFPFVLVFHCVQALIMWAFSGLFVRAYSL